MATAPITAPGPVRLTPGIPRAGRWNTPSADAGRGRLTSLMPAGAPARRTVLTAGMCDLYRTVSGDSARGYAVNSLRKTELPRPPCEAGPCPNRLQPASPLRPSHGAEPGGRLLPQPHRPCGAQPGPCSRSRRPAGRLHGTARSGAAVRAQRGMAFESGRRGLDCRQALPTVSGLETE